MTIEIFAAVLLLGAGAQGGGNGERASVPQTIEALSKCRAIAADAERLRCMDAAVDRMDAARTSGELIVLDRAKVNERRRAQFGLASSDDVATGAPAVTEVSTTIATARPAPSFGRYQIQLANGQVWETVGTTRFAPKAGAAITLRSASLGGFKADLGREVVPVKRVR